MCNKLDSPLKLELKTLNFCGKVIKGLQIGAKFGIATANLEIIGDTPDIEEGVYYVRVQSAKTREPINGILHIGELKTFGREKTCEVHLLNFNQEIYEETLILEVLKFIRPTKKFQNADLLYTQIERDIIGAEKYFLRQSIYSQWDKLNESEKSAMSRKAINKILKNSAFLSADNVYLYAPQENREISFTEKLMKKFPNKNYFFPKVIGEGKMEFCKVVKYSDLVIGKFGVLEPITNNDQTISITPDLVFIPSVAVDLKKNRLGKGGGFYDRWLASFESKKTPKIAVMPKFSIVKKVPVETHDQMVDVVIQYEAPAASIQSLQNGLNPQSSLSGQCSS